MHFQAEEALGPVLDASTEPLRLAAIAVIQRHKTAPEQSGISLQRVTGAPALRELLPHAYAFSLQKRSRKELMLKQYAQVATSTPIFRLEFGTGLSLLPTLVEKLEALLQPGGPSAF